MSPADSTPRNDHAFRVLCETSGVGFWWIDTTGRTVYLNRAMCLLLEVDTADDLGTDTHHRFFTEESLRRMSAEHDKRSSGVASTYEVELVGKRGGRRSVVISGVPVTDPDGALSGLFGCFTDITDRKRAELALHDSEQRLRSLFEASVDAIGVSRDGVHVMVNPAYVRMFGYHDERELVGTPILDLIGPTERELVRRYVRLRSRGETDTKHYLTRGLRRDGREFPLEVRVSTYEQNGAVTVVILRDITERQNLEDQLRQSQKMDALGRLAGGVAHDFNNLLTVIISSADLALTALPRGSAVAANVELIRSTGARGAALTRQLLAISRRQVIAAEVLDLHVIVDEMGAMLRRLIGSHITLSVVSGETLSRVRADAGQVQQVVMNLCVNARDAMPDGGHLTIATSNVYLDERVARSLLDVAAGHYVLLSVTDTGIGMDLETQERLFEPFFTTKDVGQGTGLGLSTVYGIVKQTGGHVAVKSALGAGSTFQVYLPAADAPPIGASVPSDLRSEAVTATVLLVEDERALRELMHRYLSQAGLRVLAAAGGPEALALHAREAGGVNVVVTDVSMAAMTGVELARELDRRAPGVPVLFLSGYPGDHADALASRPCSSFLAKPFTLPELAREVKKLLGERGAS